MTFNVERVNGDLEEVVDKLGEVQKEIREPAGRKAAGRRTETPVTHRQMSRVGVRRRRERARSRRPSASSSSRSLHRSAATEAARRRRERAAARRERSAARRIVSRTWGRVPSSREVRAKLLEGKLAARRRESEAEFETLACGSGCHLFRKT